MEAGDEAHRQREDLPIMLTDLDLISALEERGGREEEAL